MKLSHPSLSLHGMIMSSYCVQYTLSTAYTECHSASLPIYCLQIDLFQVVLQSRLIMASSAFPNLLDDNLGVHLQISTLMVSKCITVWLDLGPQVHLYTTSITAFECISKVAGLWHPSASVSSLDLGLRVHLQSCSIMAWKYMFKSTPSQRGEQAELSQHLKKICETELFWLENLGKWVTGYERVTGCEEPFKSCGSTNIQHEYMGSRPGKERFCIRYNEILINSEVSERYILCCLDYLCSFSNSEQPCQVSPAKLIGSGGGWQSEYPASMVFKGIATFSHLAFPRRWYSDYAQVSYVYRVSHLLTYCILWCSKSCDCKKDQYDRRNAMCLWNSKHYCCENKAPGLLQSCAEVSAALEVFHRPELRCQALENSNVLSVLSCSILNAPL